MQTFTCNLYEKRSFSDKFNFCIDWTKAYATPFFKQSLLFILPFCIIQGYLLQAVLKFTNSPYAGSSVAIGDMVKIGLCYAVSLISAFFAYSFFYALIKETVINKNNLQKTSNSSMWKAMRANMFKLFLSSIVGFLFIIVCGIILVLLALLSKLTLIATLPVFAAICFALLAFQPRFILTDDPILEAFTHSLKLGFKCWWGFFSTTLVMGVLVTIVQCFAYIPMYLSSIMQMFTQSFLGDIMSYVAGAFLTYVSMITSLFMVLIICVQYGHATKKIDKEEPLNIEGKIA